MQSHLSAKVHRICSRARRQQHRLRSRTSRSPQARTAQTPRTHRSQGRSRSCEDLRPLTRQEAELRRRRGPRAAAARTGEAPGAAPRSAPAVRPGSEQATGWPWPVAPRLGTPDVWDLTNTHRARRCIAVVCRSHEQVFFAGIMAGRDLKLTSLKLLPTRPRPLTSQPDRDLAGKPRGTVW